MNDTILRLLVGLMFGEFIAVIFFVIVLIIMGIAAVVRWFL